MLDLKIRDQGKSPGRHWHGLYLFMVSRRSLNSEPQNIEQEISNDEVWNRCAQSFFKIYNDRIPYFDIRYSFFQSFFFD
jgi:hypothetical protein